MLLTKILNKLVTKRVSFHGLTLQKGMLIWPRDLSERVVFQGYQTRMLTQEISECRPPPTAPRDLICTNKVTQALISINVNEVHMTLSETDGMSFGCW